MSDERILGDSAFTNSFLAEGDEAYERRYESKGLVHDAESVAGTVAEICDVDASEFLSKGKQKLEVKPRSLFCFCAVKELKMSLRELAKQLNMSPPAVGYCVEKVEGIALENRYRLTN